MKKNEWDPCLMTMLSFRFRRSVAVPGKVVLTGPYVDQWGGGHVITLSKAIVQTLVYG